MHPSITGSVVFVEMSTLVFSSLSNAEIDDIVRDVERAFDVYPENVLADVDYTISGSVFITLNESIAVDKEEFVKALEQSIADGFDIHPSNVEITSYDTSTGEATFVLTYPNVEEALDTLESLNDEDTLSSLQESLLTSIDSVESILLSPNYGVYANVELTVDATNSGNVTLATSILEETYGNDWILISDKVFITSLPTTSPSKVPSLTPTTRVPTAPPTITGLVVTIEVSRPVTSELSMEKSHNLTMTVSSAFDVAPEEVSTDISYVSSGSLELNIPHGMDEEIVADAITESLAKLLDVHPSIVSVSAIDLDTGIVEYEISSETYFNATEIQSEISGLTIDFLNEEIQQLLPSVSVENMFRDDEIEIVLSIVVDASDTTDVAVAVNGVVDTVGDDGYSISTNVAIVTSSPSTSPSFTTSIPSQHPSITGVVVTFTLVASNEDMNSTELEILESNIVSQFGLTSEDVTTDISYGISGTMSLEDVPDHIGEDELEESLVDTIANILGFHARDVHVDVDLSTGDVTYSINLDDDSATSAAIDTLNTASFLSDLNDAVADNLSPLFISSVFVDDDVELEVIVTVDATEASKNIAEASTNILEMYEEEGFSVISTRN